MKLKRLNEAQALMVKTFQALGAPEGFIGYTVEDEIYELEVSLLRDIVEIDGVTYKGHLTQLAHYDSPFTETEYKGMKCNYKTGKILYLFANEDMVKLVHWENDYYEDFEGNYIGSTSDKYAFVEISDIDWSIDAQFD